MSPWVVVAELVVIAGMNAATWVYRGNIDQAEVAAVRAQMTADAAAGAAKATADNDRKTAELQTAADGRALALAEQLQREGESNEAQVRSLHADLARAGACRIPRADVGLLVDQAKPAGASGAPRADP